MLLLKNRIILMVHNDFHFQRVIFLMLCLWLLSRYYIKLFP